jgi:hypothetical protein
MIMSRDKVIIQIINLWVVYTNLLNNKKLIKMIEEKLVLYYFMLIESHQEIQELN